MVATRSQTKCLTVVSKRRNTYAFPITFSYVIAALFYDPGQLPMEPLKI